MQKKDDQARLEDLHSKLLTQAEELLDKGEYALALQLIKHNNITAPRRDEETGGMENASSVATKLNFSPRQRVVPLKRSAG